MQDLDLFCHEELSGVDCLLPHKRRHSENLEDSENRPFNETPRKKSRHKVTFKSTLFTSPVKQPTLKELRQLPVKGILKNPPLMSSHESLSSSSDETTSDSKEEIMAQDFCAILRESMDFLKDNSAELNDFTQRVLRGCFLYILDYHAGYSTDCNSSEVVPAFPMLYLSLLFTESSYEETKKTATAFLQLLTDMSMDEALLDLSTMLLTHIRYTTLYAANREIILSCVRAVFSDEPLSDFEEFTENIIVGLNFCRYDYDLVIKEIFDWVSVTDNISATSHALSCVVYEVHRCLKNLANIPDSLLGKIELFLNEHEEYTKIIPCVETLAS